MDNLTDYKNEFKKIVDTYIKRDGINELMAWLDNSDFYEAPASTRYHGAEPGGLVRHSLAVFEQLKSLAAWYGTDIDDESIAICALFHDLCKVGVYKADTRNVKDDNGVWHKVPCYKFDEDFSYGGHGSKSVYLVMYFMKLEPEEAAAINCHMGAYDSTTYSNPSPVYSKNHLAWLLHVADEAATYMNGE